MTAAQAEAVEKFLSDYGLPANDVAIVCGGGRKNPAILDALRVRARIERILAEEAGWRGDAIEAECFAYLAVRASRGLPITFPLTTGVGAPLKGGRIAEPGRI